MRPGKKYLTYIKLLKNQDESTNMPMAGPTGKENQRNRRNSGLFIPGAEIKMPVVGEKEIKSIVEGGASIETEIRFENQWQPLPSYTWRQNLYPIIKPKYTGAMLVHLKYL